MGLIAIFAAAVVPIAVMGSILELSKIVVTSWLYRNWTVTPKLLRSYFVSAIVILMFLTSMGIFGFLSKAHVDQNLVSGDVTSKLSLIESQITIEKETLDANRKIITQLDSQVNETLSRSTDESGASRAAGLRRSQAKERNEAQKAILSAQAKINQLNTEKAPIAAEVRKVEAEVGPIKYIAALIYGDQAATDQTTLEQAVRWVIILIVLVFDPLAVLMFIAVNQDISRRKAMKHEVIIEPQHESPVIHEPEEIYKRIMEPDQISPAEPEPVPQPEPDPHAERITNRISKKKKIEWERDRQLERVE